jgi:hypothetical protein
VPGNTVTLKEERAMIYAVKCKTCEAVIKLGEADNPTYSGMHFVMPLEPIPCRECGSSYLYGNEDLLQIATDPPSTDRI